jgi:hypothetical protein
MAPVLAQLDQALGYSTDMALRIEALNPAILQAARVEIGAPPRPPPEMDW